MGAILSSPMARFADPSVATVIFAPKSQNNTLASVSFDEGFLEALGPEWWMDPSEPPRQQILRGFNWDQLEWLTSEYLRNVVRTWAASLASIPLETRTSVRDAVPARKFPFASHFSLLGGTVEGLFVDPDDSSGR